MPERSVPPPLPPLLESLPEPVFVLDAHGIVSAVNRAAESFSGHTREDLVGRGIHELLSADSYAHLRAAGGESTFAMEWDFVHASGAVSPVEVRGAADPAGGLSLMVREIAALKRFEEALRRSETRFRFMARNLTEMVMAYDMNRRLTFVNPAVETLTGYSVDEIERAQFIDWVHPEDRARMLSYWEGLFQGRGFNEEEYRLITRDGRVKWVRASWGPILDDHGRQVGVLGRERDVTDRHMAEETLRQSEQRHRLNEERYRALFEDSPFPMWEEDFSQVKLYLEQIRGEGAANLRAYLAAHPEVVTECLSRLRIVDVNLAAREFYGAPSKEVLLSSLDKIFDDAALEVFRDELVELDATNSLFRAEFQTRTLGGEERTVSMIVSVAASPVDWSRVIVSFFDITDRKRLEQQVLQSQKLESLGRLAGGIAHDFNNLLMVVLGYSELLLAEVQENERLARGLAEIRRAGERGAELTAQLLAFSRKQVARPRPMSLNQLVSESRAMLERVIGEDIRLETALAPEAWNVRADRAQLHQVVMNLVVNARDAMPSGGTLTITTRNAGGDPYPGDYVMLEVRDTGIGMDESTQQQIFEPFFTTKRRGKGTGLGLATAFAVVTGAGGHIAVESQPGQGATFRLYFPRDASPPLVEVPAGGPASRRMQGRVLVVEDQAEVREVACAILRTTGLEVIEADCGEAALALVEDGACEVDVLLTDVIMPGMNGRELATRFAEKRPGAKVIFMSGYTDRIMSPDGVLDSSVVFLQKPFKPDELTAVVRQTLAARDESE
ncbi:MAG: PAS domain S-box protein [Acidobacteria bacterium]|nr:PAS domain S-box protein [Acidobacteriota bacterium]